MRNQTRVHHDPLDPIQCGRDVVTVHENTFFLEKDFKVGPGPKCHVNLVPRAIVRELTHVAQTMSVDPAGLNDFKGSQKYALPAVIDLTKLDSDVNWREQFKVLISSVDLKLT